MYNIFMIQWFPGHMAKALNQIKEKQALADLFIIVLDARAPISSYNSEFDDISPSKPRLFVISKKDYADESKISNIVSHYKNDVDDCIIVNLKKKSAANKIVKKAEALLEHKRIKDASKGILKPRLRAFVAGVPNSGKSTLINLLASKSAAKVGNMPGVTKGQQWVNAGKIQLLDTPGILWPKFDDELTGIKLAIIGSIKTSIIPSQELTYAGYKLLSNYYPDKIKELGLKPTIIEAEIYSEMVKLAEMKKFKLTGNKSDIEKTQSFFINYLRDLTGVTYD